MKKTVWLLIWLVLAAISAASGIRNALVYSQDFQYDAAAALIHGYDPYDLSLSGGEDSLEVSQLREFYGYFENMGTPQRMEANQFPSLLYILTPFTLLSWEGARMAWLLANLLCTVLIAGLLRRTFFRDADPVVFATLMLAMVSGTPWRNQLGVGQHTLFSVMFFLMAVYFDQEGRSPYLTALSLSLSYLKYTVTAPMALYFVYKRKWKELLLSTVPHILGTWIAARSLGEAFPDMIRKPLKVASALSGEGSIDVGAIFHGSGMGFVLGGILFLLLFAAAVLLKPGHDRLMMAGLVFFSLVMTYHRSYDFFVIVIPAGFLWEECRIFAFASGARIRKAAAVSYGLVLLLMFFGLRIFQENAASLVTTGVVYYGLTLFLGAALTLEIRGKG
ncbi:MAG: DUF2029 domain-containing protein [Lachnospiraceae bacterium]|nr:DUF2029 domain-containing protein [Lachnospiraceae bacterium]